MKVFAESNLSFAELASGRRRRFDNVEWLVAGTAPVERVTVVKNNEDWHVVAGTDDETAGLDAFRQGAR